MDMKRIISILLIAAAAVLAGCGGSGNGEGKNDKGIDITGTWELINIEITKAAQLGEESIEVKITFNSDKTLTAKYSNGKAWGSSYEVSVDNSTLTMVPESGAEAYIYRKTK